MCVLAFYYLTKGQSLVFKQAKIFLGQAEMQWKFGQAEFPQKFWSVISALAEFPRPNCHLAE
jgi:hypothetical protein